MPRWMQLLETGTIRRRLLAAVLLLAALPILVLLASLFLLERMSSDARHVE